MRIEVWQPQGGDEQGVEFECAMIPRGREVRPHVGNLLRQAGEQLLRQARGQSVERRRRGKGLPGVEPVLQAAPGDVTRVSVDRHLVDPGAHEVLPGMEETSLAGVAKGVGKVQSIVKLVPLDTPLLVRRERSALPIWLPPQVERDPEMREASGTDSLCQGSVAMRMG